MLEFFEHTADLGLRVRSESFEALCAEFARGLMSLLVNDLDAVQPRREELLEISGDEEDYLLFDWLSELLYRFCATKRVFCHFDVSRSAAGLVGRVQGEAFSAERHGYGREVKAITYHGLRVQRQGEQWVAEVIVDV